MKEAVLLDTGPLVAFLNRRDQYHDWARGAFDEIEPPLLTCEAVLTEACFLVRGLAGGPEAVAAMVRGGTLVPTFRLADEIEPVARLLRRYSDVPISLADACLVRMSEQVAAGIVLTLDAGFRIYRKLGRATIPTLMPPS